MQVATGTRDLGGRPAASTCWPCAAHDGIRINDGPQRTTGTRLADVAVVSDARTVVARRPPTRSRAWQTGRAQRNEASVVASRRGRPWLGDKPPGTGPVPVGHRHPDRRIRRPRPRLSHHPWPSAIPDGIPGTGCVPTRDGAPAPGTGSPSQAQGQASVAGAVGLRVSLRPRSDSSGAALTPSVRGRCGHPGNRTNKGRPAPLGRGHGEPTRGLVSSMQSGPGSRGSARQGPARGSSA